MLSLTGLAGAALALSASSLPLTWIPCLLALAAAGPTRSLRTTARFCRGRTLVWNGGWHWEGERFTPVRHCDICFGLLLLEIDGHSACYRMVLWLPLLDREARRRLQLAVRAG